MSRTLSWSVILAVLLMATSWAVETAATATQLGSGVAATAQSAEKPKDAEPPAAANLPSADRLIEIAAKKMGAIKDFTADLAVAALPSGNAPARTGSGSYAFMAPDRLRFVMQMKQKDAQGQELAIGSSFMVLNKDVLTMVQVERGQIHPLVVRIDFAQLAEALKKKTILPSQTQDVTAPRFDCYLKEAREHGLVFKPLKVEGDLVTLEALRPRVNPVWPITRIVATISTVDGLPRSIKNYLADGRLSDTMEFSNLKFNVGLKAAEFDYQPPAGEPVNDLVEKLKAEMPKEKERLEKAEKEQQDKEKK